MRFVGLTTIYLRRFEWHDWFAWYPIRNPEGWMDHWVWLETVRRRKVAVGPQGLTGNYEWRYQFKSHDDISRPLEKP